jgi:hypothetical protein
MKIFRNTVEIERKERLGRRFSLGGMLVLLVGLIASFVPTWYPPGTEATSSIGQFMQNNWAMISFAALPLGFLAASLGSYYVTRYSRRRWPGPSPIARPDEYLERSLKGMDDKHSFFVFSLPIGYALLSPTTLITLAVRSDRGRVRVAGDKWREGWSVTRIFGLFAREGVGNPPSELDSMIGKMRQFLSTEAAVQAGVNVDEVPIEGAVVFLNSEVVLELDNPTVAVLRADELKEYVRKRSKENRPPPALMRAVAAYLQQNNKASSKVTDEEPTTVASKKSQT